MKNVMVGIKGQQVMGSLSEDAVKDFSKSMAALGYDVVSYEAGKVPFEMLPKEVKDEALDTLKAYDRVRVEYAGGEYKVTTGCCIASRYAYDQCVCSVYYAKDLYTEEERQENFKEVFGYEQRVR